MKFELKRNMRKIRDLYYETSIRFHLTDFQKLSCYGKTHMDDIAPKWFPL